MEYYKIINDLEALKEFVNWLPELKDNEQFYVCLFARKKYSATLKKAGDKTQLKRFTSTKERLIEKIKQLEIPVGGYTLKGDTVPQDALVLYIMPNPRCMRRATEEMAHKCIDLITSDASNFNLHAHAMSCIQKSKSRRSKFVVDFDIDTKDIDLTPLNDIIPECSRTILETRGGYHILVRPDYVGDAKLWHNKIRELFVVDQVGDQMIPVPGCIQGNFVPKFINI